MEQTYCNICFKYNICLKQLSEVDNANITTLRKLQFCVPEVEDWNDNFLICPTCFMELKNAIKFRQLCIHAFLVREDARNQKVQKGAFPKKTIECKFCNEKFWLRHVLEMHQKLYHQLLFPVKKTVTIEIVEPYDRNYYQHSYGIDGRDGDSVNELVTEEAISRNNSKNIVRAGDLQDLTEHSLNLQQNAAATPLPDSNNDEHSYGVDGSGGGSTGSNIELVNEESLSLNNIVRAEKLQNVTACSLSLQQNTAAVLPRIGNVSGIENCNDQQNLNNSKLAVTQEDPQIFVIKDDDDDSDIEIVAECNVLKATTRDDAEILVKEEEDDEADFGNLEECKILTVTQAVNRDDAEILVKEEDADETHFGHLKECNVLTVTHVISESKLNEEITTGGFQHFEESPRINFQHHLFKDPTVFTGMLTKVETEFESDKNLRCNYCNQCFNSTIAFELHIETEHSGEQTNTKCLMKTGCDERKQEFDDFKQLCNLCGTAFINRDELNQHNDEIHGSNMEIKIEIEETKILLHGPIDEFICYDCNQCFNDKLDLILHIKVEHNQNIIIDDEIDNKSKSNNRRKSHQCTICNKSFKHNYELNRHIRNVHVTEKRFQCELCPNKFAAKIYLNRHKRQLHSEANFSCPICLKAFPTREQIVQHKLRHNQRTIHCEICPKSYKTSRDLNKHISWVHADRSTWKYQCDLCHRRYFRKSYLDNHIKMHAKKPDRNHLCHLCGHKCRDPSRLQSHLANHSYDKLFQCQICNASFKIEQTLKKHMAKHENNTEIPKPPKKHQCPFCPKSFQFPSKLRIHIRVHTNERPFKCGFCPTAFISKMTLKNHKIKFHNDSNPNIN